MTRCVVCGFTRDQTSDLYLLKKREGCLNKLSYNIITIMSL